MGNFYVTHSVKHADQQAVAEVLRGGRRSAYVTPPAGGYVVVYDEESDSQDAEEVASVGKLLSRKLQAPVLAVMNHDDDVLYYWLFEQGKEVDDYCSCPDYFGEDDSDEYDEDAEPEERGGDADLLCRVLGVPEAVEAVEAIIHGEEGAVFVVQQHAALAEALGLPKFSVGMGFRYLENGELPDGLRQEQLVRVGSKGPG